MGLYLHWKYIVIEREHGEDGNGEPQPLNNRIRISTISDTWNAENSLDSNAVSLNSGTTPYSLDPEENGFNSDVLVYPEMHYLSASNSENDSNDNLKIFGVISNNPTLNTTVMVSASLEDRKQPQSQIPANPRSAHSQTAP